MENTLIYKNLNEIFPYDNNPRQNDGAVEAVANSILEFGFKVPIIIDRNDVIVAGHTRYKAGKRLGLETVPCIIADDLTDEQVKAYRLADNKVGELAEWDLSKLEEELASLEMDMDLFGFDIDMSDLEEELSEPKERKDLSDEEGGRYEVIIECVDEEEQERIYEQLMSEGYTCRVLTL